MGDKGERPARLANRPDDVDPRYEAYRPPMQALFSPEEKIFFFMAEKRRSLACGPGQ